MSAERITRTAFRALADRALEASPGDHTFVALQDRQGGTARFANNQVVQHVSTRRQELTVSVNFGRRVGTSTTTRLTTDAVAAVVKRAAALAKLAPEDPEYLPPLPPQRVHDFDPFAPETAAAGPTRLLRNVETAVTRCEKAKLSGAGIATAYASAHGIAADTGLFAFEPRSFSQFSVTATGGDASGWAKRAHRSIDALDVEACVAAAIDKAKRAASPREVPAGRYTVILEPAAVAGLIGPLLWTFDARSYDRGTSALSGRLGERVINERLTLRNHPEHPALRGDGFDGSGLPTDARVWIDRGVLKQLHYDRFTAREKGVEPTAGIRAPHLQGSAPPDEESEPAAASVADLVAGTERGILVTNFWYIRHVNPTDLTLTGMTRDGTFLVEDGKITTGLLNFRWHDSPLRAFDAVDAYTLPLPASAIGRHKMLLPAVRIRDFHFSSVSRF